MTSADDKAFGKSFDSDSDSVDVGLGVLHIQDLHRIDPSSRPLMRLEGSEQAGFTTEFVDSKHMSFGKPKHGKYMSFVGESG